MEIERIDKNTIYVPITGAYSGKKFNLMFTVNNKTIDSTRNDYHIKQLKDGNYENIDGIQLTYLKSTIEYITYLDLSKLYKFNSNNKKGRIKSTFLAELERSL